MSHSYSFGVSSRGVQLVCMATGMVARSLVFRNHHHRHNYHHRRLIDRREIAEGGSGTQTTLPMNSGANMTAMETVVLGGILEAGNTVPHVLEVCGECGVMVSGNETAWAWGVGVRNPMARVDRRRAERGVRSRLRYRC